MCRKIELQFGFAPLLAAAIPLAHAHHAMDYALPASALEGFLSGIGHPVIGVDHLLFVVGAGVVAALFLAAGTIHGHALAEAIVGAERTPLAAYLAGLTVIQCVIGLAAWRTATWAAVRNPKLPVRQLAGTVAGIAGIVFSGMVLMG